MVVQSAPLRFVEICAWNNILCLVYILHFFLFFLLTIIFPRISNHLTKVANPVIKIFVYRTRDVYRCVFKRYLKLFNCV